MTPPVAVVVAAGASPVNASGASWVVELLVGAKNSNGSADPTSVVALVRHERRGGILLDVEVRTVVSAECSVAGASVRGCAVVEAWF